ncbi:YybH family protein [Bremerella sp. T1]|uniref:YybH family protein n=1 Tax=Bremerella sp. TYQ1 TaxID=3119568 RepID=UPI001CCDE4DA|nr:SgcJ/EcaC family oxidoreductase [Bremerella volcania]UBM35453.1 SgcJ/EcaC family oxidoreductase [Bremerella volcania]
MKRIASGLLVILMFTSPCWSQETEPAPPAAPEAPAGESSPMPEPEPTADAETLSVGEATVEIEFVLNEDESAILKAIDSYAEAFNKGDAKALAQHWTVDGEFVTPSGDVLKGRAALEEDFTAYFEQNAGVKLELVDTQIKLLSPHVASETGVARVLLPEQEPSETIYEAFHVKTAEGWRIDSVKEDAPAEPAPSHYERLQPLQWMIGTWVDDSEDDVTVETSSRWTTNQNFIVRTFRVFMDGVVDFEGTQVIGWDPSVGAIRSWTFDSDGGFGVGRWTQQGSRWTVQSLNVLPDGRRGSSTNIYDLVDENTVQFKTIGRQVDGELLPNVSSITIIRAE